MVGGTPELSPMLVGTHRNSHTHTHVGLGVFFFFLSFANLGSLPLREDMT